MTMSTTDKIEPTEAERMKKIAEDTTDPQMKRAIDERLKRMSKDNEVRKDG